MRTRNKYKYVIARVKGKKKDFLISTMPTWSFNDLSKIRYFDTEDEAIEFIEEYTSLKRRNPRIKDPYDYTISNAIDSWSYGAVQEFLPEDVLDEIIEMLKNGAPRGEIHKKFGYLLTPISATVLRREYNYFKSLGFGNYKPRKKENEEK